MRREDEHFMREALRLAEKGRGRVQPNPMVGAVLVKNSRIIARGWHRHFGGAHAEVEALERAGKNARGATLYVTLEPCAHWGKTPPCADLIIKSDISRIVIAGRDTNGMARDGIARLRKARIKIAVGILEKEARALNVPFYTFHEQKRPFVALKFAASLDGKLATRTGESKWITNEAARRFARRLRGEHMAVLVGIETILADDPRLTARTSGLREPLRIMLDSRLRIPLRARVLKDGNALVVTTSKASAQKRALLQRRGIRVMICGREYISIPQLLRSLRKIGIQSVLVEGGGAVLGSFLDSGIVEKVYAFCSPILIGGDTAVTIGGRGIRRLTDAVRFKKISLHRFDDNVLIVGTL